MSELRFDNVTVRYGSTTAVDDVSLTVPSGQVLGLVGESGSGKSTLARAAVGLAPVESGQILLDGKPVPTRGRRRPLQMVFQDPYSSLDPRMSIGESVAEAIPPGMSRAERRAEVDRLLELVHLDPDRVAMRPAALSGGQRQRVALARALAGQPQVIVADEITSALDVSIQGAVLNLVRDLQRELGLTILFISHNLAVVRYVASHVAVMHNGRIVEQGPTAQVLAEPEHDYTRDAARRRTRNQKEHLVTRRMRINDLTAIAVPSQPALSPDGTRIVYVLRTLDGDADRNVDQLWTVPAAGGTPRRLTSGPSDAAPVWSPDGSRLAFLREGQVFVLPADGGEPEKVDRPAAGRRRAGVEPERRADRVQRAGRPDRWHRPARREAPRLPGRRLRALRRRPPAAACPRPRRRPRDAQRPPGHRRPRPRRPAGLVGRRPHRRVHPPARRGQRPHLPHRGAPARRRRPQGDPIPVAFEDGVAGTVSFSADGESLLVVGYPTLALGHAHLVRVPLDGGAPVDLTGHLDRNVMPGGPAYPGARPVETADGRLLFAIRDRGCSHLWDETGPLLAGAGRVVSGLSVAGSTAVVALATPTSYGEIVALDLETGAETVLTEHGAGLADVELFVREERTFTISDGSEVQGWLVRDPEREGPLPLLLDIHGGPHNAWNAAADEMHIYQQQLAAQGWAVLMVNPRGSDGYGADFYNGVNGAWGVADVNDFLEPIDALVAEGLADADKLAVTGYSYGGFMTCWLTGHDDRFKAGVAGGPVSDLVSEYGTCDGGALMARYELGGTPWDAPEQYAAMSPLTNVDQVTTPTLILHAKDDLACPVGQAQQWHTSLRQRGVPTELVIYPEASHVFILLGPPSQRMDYNNRVVAWVEQYVERGGRPASTAPTGSAGSRCSPRSTTCPAPSSASSTATTSSRRRTASSTTGPASRRPSTRSSRSARSARCGRPRSSCS